RLRRIRAALLRWSAADGRKFFWREASASAFAVLVTEILLTKTRAELVEPIALVLLQRFQNPSELARAVPRDLERLLFPLGLHRKRARSLIACAKWLVDDHDGNVPRTVPDLMQLPGVGRYAASAVASVAFGARLPIVDANVSRILQRLF